MSDQVTELRIGELARRAGLSVRTIRFYSDAGIVPELRRTDTGYRLYGSEAVARLRLIRTLRELGVGLDTIRAVLAGELTVREVAERHATALEAQIRSLWLQLGVLRAIAARPDDPEVLEQMHELATLTAQERRRIIDEFIEEVFAGLPADAGVRARMEAAPPDLPEDPSPEQIDAWVELAQLVADPEFRARTREMALYAAAEPDAGAAGVSAQSAQAVETHAGAALAERIDPASRAGGEVLEGILEVVGEPASRERLAERLATFTDRRVGRYWSLLGVINGWPPVPDATPAWEWFADALRAHRDGHGVSRASGRRD
jgi:DNA-binding transcriptional MerR regulator